MVWVSLMLLLLSVKWHLFHTCIKLAIKLTKKEMNQNLKHFSLPSNSFIHSDGIVVWDWYSFVSHWNVYLFICFTGSQGQKKGGRTTKQIKQNPMNWTELLPPPPVNPPPCHEYTLAMDDRWDQHTQAFTYGVYASYAHPLGITFIVYAFHIF